MTLIPATPTLGDVLVDTDLTSMSLHNYDAFKDGYEKLLEPMDIIGLFALAEACVLHERLVSERIDDRDFASREAVRKLVDAGVLARLSPIMDYDENKPDSLHEQFWAQLEPITPAVTTWWPGAAFTLSASMRRAEWSDANNIDHLAWPLFGSLPSVAMHRRHAVVHRGYEHVSSIFKSNIEVLRGSGAPIPLFIPPIPALVLERCGGQLSRSFDEVLALREEFDTARRKLWSYQGVLANNESRSVGELLQAYRDSVADVTRALDRLAAKRTDSKLVMELWDTTIQLGVSSKEDAIAAEPRLNLAALLGRGFRWLEDRRIRARARLFFDVYEKALQIRQYGHLVTRLFKTEESDLRRATDSLSVIGRKIDEFTATNRLTAWGS